MSTATLVSVSEYLETCYRPDCDYLEGEVLERNVGEFEHSRLQLLIGGYLLAREKKWGIVVTTEWRVQVKPARFRIPDITVVQGPRPSSPILTEPPFLCIEILSPGDSMRQMQSRIDDYLNFGVPNVWIVDPLDLRAFHYNTDGMSEAKDGVLRTHDPDIEVPLRELEAK